MKAVILETGNNRTIYKQVTEVFRKKNIRCFTGRAATENAADILVAGEGIKATKIKSPVLVAPGETAAALTNDCGARVVVTYGYDSRDTLTLSSALQREIPAINGGVTYPREIDLTPFSGSISEKMAVTATMMVLNGEEMQLF